MRRLFYAFFLLPLFGHSQFEGEWYASFNVMGQAMRMQLEVSSDPDTSVLLINPDSELSAVCEELAIQENTINFTWKAGNLSYHGTLFNDSITGKMSQSGLTWEVIFTRNTQKLKTINRWQEPKPPITYTADSLLIQNEEIVLGATLVLPENFSDRSPIIIMASGSGPQDRDSQIAGHRSFWVIADHLARHGIASLRFDDRGTGVSSGNSATASLLDFGSDVTACAKYLRKVKKFKKNPLGILGHSEGGMHAFLALSDYSKIDFLIQLATAGTSGEEVLVQQQYDIPKASGRSDELCTWNSNLFQEMVRIVSDYPQDKAADSLQAFLSNAYDNTPEDFDKTAQTKAQFILGYNAFMNNVWMRQFVAFRTDKYLTKTDVPILAIHGSRDIQVAAETNSAPYAAYKNGTAHILEGLNHLLQPCTVCDISEYGTIETTIDPQVLHLMTDWILHLEEEF